MLCLQEGVVHLNYVKLVKAFQWYKSSVCVYRLTWSVPQSLIAPNLHEITLTTSVVVDDLLRHSRPELKLSTPVQAQRHVSGRIFLDRVLSDLGTSLAAASDVLHLDALAPLWPFICRLERVFLTLDFFICLRNSSILRLHVLHCLCTRLGSERLCCIFQLFE